MSRIVSADEARKLLNAYRAPASDRPLTLNGSEDVAMFRAAPDLAHTVARLHDILAAERGERAPERWERRRTRHAVDTDGDEWGWYRVDHPMAMVVRGTTCWCWQAGSDGDLAPMALEAIEAVDRSIGATR